MSIQVWSFILVGITFAIYIVVAVKSKAGNTSEFYVAGKGVHPVINGMATAADWMSAASFISMAGLIAFMGYQGSQYLLAGRVDTYCWHCFWLPTSGNSESSQCQISLATGIIHRRPGS